MQRIFTLLIAASILQNTYAQIKKLTKIEVKYIHREVETVNDVPYNKFDSSFPSRMFIYKVISDGIYLLNFEHALVNIKFLNTNRSVDVRYKICFISNTSTGSSTIAYSDYFGNTLINGKPVARCRFKTLLMSLIKSLEQ
jgi:hypothetical protein